MEKKTYVIAQDIVIPAGTVLSEAPVKILRYTPFVEAIIGPTPDTTFCWSMPLDEAIETGLAVEASNYSKFSSSSPTTANFPVVALPTSEEAGA